MAGRGHEADPAADRFRRHQLLHARRHPARRRGLAVARVARAAAAGYAHRNRLGGVPARPDRHAGLGEAAIRRHPAVRHRERRRLLRPAGGRGRPHRRPAAGRLLAQAHRCRGAGPKPGRGPARVLRVVAAGQPGVGARLLQALRPRARRLRDPGAHAQGQRTLLRRRDRRPPPWRGAGGLTMAITARPTGRRGLLRAAGALGALQATGCTLLDRLVASNGSSEEELPVNIIEDLAHRTFRYFWETTSAKNGLAPDRWPSPSVCSIAAVGFALTAYC